MKYAVRWMDEAQEEEIVEFFPTVEAAKEKVKTLIKQAEDESQDADGRTPYWALEITLLQVLGDVTDLGGEGLRLKMRS